MTYKFIKNYESGADDTLDSPVHRLSISNTEFINILNRYAEMYMKKFWCIKSEKDIYLEYLSRAKENFKA